MSPEWTNPNEALFRLDAEGQAYRLCNAPLLSWSSVRVEGRGGRFPMWAVTAQMIFALAVTAFVGTNFVRLYMKLPAGSATIFLLVAASILTFVWVSQGLSYSRARRHVIVVERCARDECLSCGQSLQGVTANAGMVRCPECSHVWPRPMPELPTPNWSLFGK